MALGQYMAIQAGTWWYRVSIGLLCLYVLKKVEIWSGVTDAGHTHRQHNIDDKATQLVLSLKFKLSHAT